MNYKQTPITWGNPRVSEALSQQPRGKTGTSSPLYNEGTCRWRTQSNRQTLRGRTRACAVLKLHAHCKRVCRGHEKCQKAGVASRDRNRGTERWRKGEKQEGGRHRGRRDGKGQKDFSSILQEAESQRKASAESIVMSIRGQQQDSNLGQLDSNQCFFSLEQTCNKGDETGRMKSHENRVRLHSIEGLQAGRTVKTCTHSSVGCGPTGGPKGSGRIKRKDETR